MTISHDSASDRQGRSGSHGLAALPFWVPFGKHRQETIKLGVSGLKLRVGALNLALQVLDASAQLLVRCLQQ